MADANSVRASGAFIEIFSKDAELQKGLKKAQKDIENFGKAVLKVGTGLGAIGAGITAPLILATNQFAESGAALKDMSDRTGVSVETLSLLGYAAKQTGADIGAVEIGIRRMQKSLTAGSLENVQAQQTFANLGLSVQALTRLKPEEQFAVIGKRIAMIKDESARAGAAMMIFGRSGTELIPMALHMEKLSKEAHEFGLITKTETAEAAKSLKDSMGLLDAVIGKITSKIGSALAPAFEKWNIQAAKVGKQIMDLIDENKPLIPLIFQAGLAFTAAGIAVVALGTAIVGTGAVIGGIATTIGAIHTGLLLMLSPIGLIVLGFAGMTTAMGKWGETGAAVTNFMKTQFAGLLTTAQETFSGIANAMKAGDIALAGQILWAGIKVEWLKGIQYVSGLWGEVSTSGIDAFTTLKGNIASILIDVWAGMEAGAVKASFAISGAFSNVWDNLKIGWSAVTAFIGNAWDLMVKTLSLGMIEFGRLVKFEYTKIKDLVTGVAFDAAAHGKALAAVNAEAAEAKKNVEEEFTGKAAARGQATQGLIQERDAGVEARQKAKEETLGQIEQGRQGAQAALLSGEDTEAANRQKAQQDKAAAAAAELADAQKALANLTTDARVLALGKGEKGLTIPGAARGEGQEGLSPEGLDRGIEQAKKSVDVHGGFSAQALVGMGAGDSLQKEMAKDSKRTADGIDKLNNKARQGQIVFST